VGEDVFDSTRPVTGEAKRKNFETEIAARTEKGTEK
jgi:hypothetical protein